MKIIILILNHILFLIKIKSKFILPLMRTTQFQNTIFLSGPKLYNIMFGNILKNNSIKNINMLLHVILHNLIIGIVMINIIQIAYRILNYNHCSVNKL